MVWGLPRGVWVPVGAELSQALTQQLRKLEFQFSSVQSLSCVQLLVPSVSPIRALVPGFRAHPDNPGCCHLEIFNLLMPVRPFFKGQVTFTCVRDLIFLSRQGRDLGFAFQAPPGSQASSRGEAKDSAVLSSSTGISFNPQSQGGQVSMPVVRGSG